MTNDRRNHLELSTRAKRDLRKLRKQDRQAHDRILGALKHLEEGRPNLDMTVITDRPPFVRLRVGDFRILLQPLTAGEIQRLVLRHGTLSATKGYIAARVIDRAELDRAVATLESCEIA